MYAHFSASSVSIGRRIPNTFALTSSLHGLQRSMAEDHLDWARDPAWAAFVAAPVTLAEFTAAKRVLETVLRNACEAKFRRLRAETLTRRTFPQALGLLQLVGFEPAGECAPRSRGSSSRGCRSPCPVLDSKPRHSRPPSHRAGALK